MVHDNIMKAAIIEEFGSPNVLKVKSIEVPKITKDEILIKVKAASINPMDWKIRKYGFNEGYKVNFPLVLGMDIAGVIVDIDQSFPDFKLVDRVYGYIDISRMGGYAEYVIALPNEIACIPKGMSFNEAASLPVAGITAMMGLFDLVNIKPNQTVLIHGAAGGVGSIAIQLAKYKKARVIGTASPYNHDFLKNLGVDKVVDYNKNWFEEIDKNVDVVFDSIGGETQIKSFGLLKRNGTLISIANPPSQYLATKHSVNVDFVWALPSKHHLRKMNNLYMAKKLQPIVFKTFPLDNIRESHFLSETGHLRGKIIIEL